MLIDQTLQDLLCLFMNVSISFSRFPNPIHHNMGKKSAGFDVAPINLKTSLTISRKTLSLLKLRVFSLEHLQPTLYFFFFSHFSYPNTKTSFQSILYFSLYFLVYPNGSSNVESHLSSLNSLSTFFSLYLSLYICLTFFKLLEVMCKIESVVGVYFKKLLVKIVNLIFKYILSSYFVKCD